MWHVRVENYYVDKISYSKHTAEFTDLAPASVNIKSDFAKGPMRVLFKRWLHSKIYYFDAFYS